MSIHEDLSAALQTLDWFTSMRMFEEGLPEKPEDAACTTTVGGDAERVQNVPGTAWMHYGIELRVRAKNQQNARDRIKAAANYLDGITNTKINGVMFRSIFQIAPPILVERYPGGRATYSVSFNIVRRDSDDG